MQVTLKNVEKDIFREFKAEAVREDLALGKAVTLAMKFWLVRARKKPKLSILDLKPTSWGRGTERLSIEADEVLY